jgi:hypothetical protein
MFTPRFLTAGHVCCSREYALCDECKRHFGIEVIPLKHPLELLRNASLRTNVHIDATSTHEETPMIPDPYAIALAKRNNAVAPPDHTKALRAMSAFRGHYIDVFHTPHMLPPAQGDVYSKPPDSYQIALARKKEGRS